MEQLPVIILGAGVRARIALDIFQSNDVVVYGFLDDDQKLHGTEIDNIPVLGATDNEGFTKLIGKKCNVCIAVDSQMEAKKLWEFIIETRKVKPVAAIHNRAWVSSAAWIEDGVEIQAGALVLPGAKIEEGTQIGAGAIIDSNATIGSYSAIGLGSRIGTGVQMASEVFVGAGAVIIPEIKVGKGASIGAGSVVIANVDAKSRVFGNPASKV